MTLSACKKQVEVIKPQLLNCSYNNQSIAAGDNIIGYESSKVLWGRQCTKLVASCDGNTGKFSSDIFPTCSIEPGISCPYLDRIIPSGGYVRGFKKNPVKYNESCEEQIGFCHGFTGQLDVIPYPTCESEPIVISYEPVYSPYSICSASLPCSGIGVQTRTLNFCQKKKMTE